MAPPVRGFIARPLMLAATTRRRARLPKVSTSSPVVKSTAAFWPARESLWPKAPPTKSRRSGVAKGGVRKEEAAPGIAPGISPGVPQVGHVVSESPQSSPSVSSASWREGPSARARAPRPSGPAAGA